MRVALYYAPALQDPLWPAACAWLGRDPEHGCAIPGSPVPAPITADAALYGFHCTLKPPMRLCTDYGAFLEDADRLAARTAAFHMPALTVTDLSGFLAICEAEPSPALRRLADACVEQLDQHRAHLTVVELARRRAAGLSVEREAYLLRWGYPLVFEEWRFHMTLTRRLTGEEQAGLRPLAEAHFTQALSYPRACTHLTVFTQPAPGQHFRIAERLPLRG